MEMIFCGKDLKKASLYVEELRNYDGGEIAYDVTILTGTGKAVIFNGDVRGSDAFVVLKNADFNEGRGPLLVDSIFKDVDAAIVYVLQQEGICGTKQRVQTISGRNIHNKVYVYTNFNGYEIQPMTMR